MAGKFFNGNKTFDKALIDQMVAKMCEDVYAGLLLAMYHELKLEPEDIKRVVVASQEIWDEYSRNGWDIKASCLECTEVEVRHISREKIKRRDTNK